VAECLVSDALLLIRHSPRLRLLYFSSFLCYFALSEIAASDQCLFQLSNSQFSGDLTACSAFYTDRTDRRFAPFSSPSKTYFLALLPSRRYDISVATRAALRASRPPSEPRPKRDPPPSVDGTGPKSQVGVHFSSVGHSSGQQ
jgi:hypothetical protein